MKNSIKKRVGVIACVCAVALLVGATFALFSTTSTVSQSGKVGNVKVSVTDLDVENFENVNPGDNDPDLPEDPDDPRNPGTPHDITFTVSNDGNKSIVTRNVITISAEDVDPTVFKIVDGDAEAVEKFYVVGDSDLTQEEYAAQSEVATAVKYIISGDVFDGKGTDLSAGGDAEKEDGSIASDDDNVSPSKSYTYALAMSYGVDDEEYEGKGITINVEVQGMQYRNSNNSDWQTIFSDGVTI